MADDTVSVKVDGETKRELRIRAAKEDVSMSEWIRTAIEEKIERDVDMGNRIAMKATAD